MNSRAGLAELALALVCFFWGATFVLVKNALTDISPMLFLAIRFSIASTLLAGVYALRRGSAKVIWGGGIICGVFLMVGYFLQTLGLRFDTTPAKSGFLTALYIPLVPVLIAIVYRKLPSLSEWLGVGLATAGMAMMTLTAESLRISLGDALTVGCAVAYAIHILLLSHFSRLVQTEWLALLQILTCAVVAISTVKVVESPFVRWTPNVWLALGVTSALSTALAFLLQTWGQKHTTPTRAALVFSLEPVFAWLTSYVVEHEVLTGRVLAGAACILSGILLVEIKPLGRRQTSEKVKVAETVTSDRPSTFESGSL